MQMKFLKDRKGGAVNASKLKGRTGHRVVGANGSIFVVGGRSEGGLWQPQVHRINCDNQRIDSLILDNSLCIQDFALFWFQESLFVWGGYSLEQYSNQLFQFDGSRFTPLKQVGEIPKPRANHSYATFGGKYLIIFGGHNQQQFFNDWFLLNIKKLEWSRLNPSMALNFGSGSKMVWANGRGFLLINEVYDQQLNFYQPNLFFQFHMTDFQSKKLKILPLAIKFDSSIPPLILTHLLPFNQHFIVAFGGHHPSQLTDIHDFCFLIDIEHEKAQKVNLGLVGAGFQGLLMKQILYIVGGSEQIGNTGGVSSLKLCSAEKQFRRHVCWMCNTYFDEQWLVNSKQNYRRYRIKEEVDYNYSMKVDNSVLQRMANYISHEFFALTLLLQTIKPLNPTHVYANFINVQHPYSKEQIGQKNLQYLRLLFEIPQQLICPLINQIKLQNIFNQNTEIYPSLSLLVLLIKLAAFRMAKSTLMVFKLDPETVYVIYFSSCQHQCTNSNFNTFTNNSYQINLRSNQCPQPSNRHIISQDLKHIFKNQHQYEDIYSNWAIFSICGSSLEADVLISQQNGDLQTGDTNIGSLMKDEAKRTVPLIQLSFLPNYELPPIFIEEVRLKIYNLYDMIQNDVNSNILKPIDWRNACRDSRWNIFEKICLCAYPEQYWFKKVLVYHKGRLINRLNFSSKEVCGIIQLNPNVSLDLSSTNFQRHTDRQAFQEILKIIIACKKTRSG